MKKAFTLVELAIVLVIIGLLTAGVVGGQSLIESSKNQSIISDYNKYKTAINAFKLEYDAIPGDFADANQYWGLDCEGATTGTNTCSGSGNNVVDYVTANNDSWKVWQHLAKAGIINGKYTGTYKSPACSSPVYCSDVGINVPKAANEAGWHMIILYNTSTWAGKAQTRHVFALGNPKNDSNGWWYGPAISPKNAKTIDSKIDDGIPNQGFVTNMSQYFPNCTSSTVMTTSGMTYTVTNTTPQCVLFFDSGI